MGEHKALRRARGMDAEQGYYSNLNCLFADGSLIAVGENLLHEHSDVAFPIAPVVSAARAYEFVVETIDIEVLAIPIHMVNEEIVVADVDVVCPGRVLELDFLFLNKIVVNVGMFAVGDVVLVQGREQEYVSSGILWSKRPVKTQDQRCSF